MEVIVKPKIVAFVSPNSASRVRKDDFMPARNAPAGMCATITAPNRPPSTARRSPNTTSTGNMTTPASMRGVMRNETESKPIASSASTCSVTRIDPISAVMVAPTFPASTSAVRSGVSSSRTDLMTSPPTTDLGIHE